VFTASDEEVEVVYDLLKDHPPEAVEEYNQLDDEAWSRLTRLTVEEPLKAQVRREEEEGGGEGGGGGDESCSCLL